jgi:hypothetical protein
MKIKTTRSVTEEHEVELPIYRKKEGWHYKVFSPEKCIQVAYHKYMDTAISIVAASLAWQFADTVDCTKEEFDEAFNMAIGKLTKIAE